jgi:cobalt-zinc-cadmium resistance protein CzcA
MSRIVDFILKQRLLVLLATLIILGLGIYSFETLSVDAFPDVTNVQVQILSTVPQMSPPEVERSVTVPIEFQMAGLPGLMGTRSLSKFGLSLVTVLFEDDVDIYFARQLVLQRLVEAKEALPKGVEPVMAPVTTGLGEIYHYTLEGEGKSLMDLRTIQDWSVRRLLRRVTGVTDVNSFGGEVKEYQVIVNPEKLLKYGLTLRQVFQAVGNNNMNASGSFIHIGSEQYIVRGLGLVKGLDDIGSIVVAAHHGTPVYVRDVADLRIGPAIRLGAAMKNGKETAAGIVLLTKGGNSRDVVERVKNRVKEIAASLPEGVRIVSFYDRAELVHNALGTITRALAEGTIFVVLVLFLFLGNARSALVVTLTLPLTMLTTFIIMRYAGLTANLMSLGGIAIALGMVVDGGVVIVENIYRHLSERKGEPAMVVVADASGEVLRPVFFGVLIIVVSFFPLFTLQGVEGKMFIPLALTKTIASVASLFISILVVPVLAFFIVRGGSGQETRLIRAVKRWYMPVLDWALIHRGKVTLIGLASLVLALLLLPFVGKEFMPVLQEGQLTIQHITLPGISLNQAIETEKRFHEILLSFPEVESVVSRIGSAEIATDPDGPEHVDNIITLKPRKQWETARTKEELNDKIRERLEASLPGVAFNFTQPIALRVDELISGVKSQIAVKLFGDDLDTLKKIADRIARVMATVKGTEDLRVEQLSGQPYLQIDIDRPSIARYGINVSDVQEVIETAVAGGSPTDVFEGDKRFAVRLRFPEAKRNDVQTIGNMLVPLPGGHGSVPMRQLARLALSEGPSRISREDGQRRIVVECNVEGRDMGGFVKEARQKLGAQVKLPEGYRLEWGGQFENQERAMKRLVVIVPLTLLLIFLFLTWAFNSIRNALLIIMNIPFSLSGGVAGLLLAGQYLSVPASVGFIALFSVAVLNGIVLVSYFNKLRQEGATVEDAVRRGAALRLRPVLMTATVTMLGLVPLLFASGTGSEVQRPLAAVVVGGLVTSTLLTLIVLPALYTWFEKKEGRV